MKGIIIYQSKGGATATYAHWLAEETGFSAVPVQKARRLADYDIIVLGSCVRMYKPTMGRWIRQRWTELRHAKLAFFTVAGAGRDKPVRAEWVIQELGADRAASLPHFPLEGRMKFAELPWLDRTLMRMGIKMVARTRPDEARAMAQEYDRVDRSTLEGLRRQLKAWGVALKAV